MQLSALPKVELHHHLDCDVRYPVIVQSDPDISKGTFEARFVAPARCDNLAEYLTYPSRTVALLQDRPMLRSAVEDVFAQLVEDGVVYTEIRFAPLLHCEEDLSPQDVVDVVSQAVEEQVNTTGVEANLILCTLRHFTRQQSLQTVHLVHEFTDRRVVALDLAGSEADYSLNNHVDAFEYARNHGIPTTAHAGEASGPKSVWDTLRLLKPDRLGHGVRSIEDPLLVEQLVARGIHLEVCPTCNVQTGIVATYADHPIRRLYEQGVSLGINTDARVVTPISLTVEYDRLAEVFGWGVGDFFTCNMSALNASFAPPEVKRRLSDHLIQSYCSVSDNRDDV